MSVPSQRSARVVVVDDDRLIREMACDALAELVRAEPCADAEAALAALAREPADLVVSDLTMPGATGLELLERVRREHPGTDFVLMTANASVESAVGALRMGAADYLVKPVHAGALCLAVERVLTRRRLLQENSRLRNELATLDACRALVRCLDPGEVYAVALDLLLAALPCERGLALFRRTSVPTSDGVAFRGFEEVQARRLRELILEEKPLDMTDDPEPKRVERTELHELLREVGVHPDPALLVPVRGREGEQGQLWIFEGPGRVDEPALQHARLVRAHAELALQNAERYHKAKERAFLDDVTEAYNARFLLQATEREIQRAERYGKELCVLFLDLDRFKLVNDRHGHLVGSEVLRRLARLLQDCIRQVDTLGRYGGDEFTILLVDSDAAEGMAVAERIRRTVADTLFEGGGGQPIQLTISIGVATYPADGRDRDSLLDAADKAMYRAKSRGRNCIAAAADLEG